MCEEKTGGAIFFGLEYKSKKKIWRALQEKFFALN